MPTRCAGLLRTLAHFHDGAQTEETIAKAEAFIQEHLDWTSLEIAQHLTKLASPKGIVEKSISTAREADTLRRVHEAWPNAKYIHITRQPEDIMQSVDKRLARAIEQGKTGWMMRKAEIYSSTDYYNDFTIAILEFMASLPPGTCMDLRGEDFLTDARFYTRQICEWAGLRVDDAVIEGMMHPENNPFAFLGPSTALRGLSPTFIDNPHYSGEPVPIKALSNRADDEMEPGKRKAVLLANRLGYE